MPEGTQTQDPPKPLFKEIVPAEFHDRGYLKDLLDKPDAPETRQELFKRLDGAQKLIGQRPAGIPGPDAKPEEVEKFLASLRPEKAEDYDFKALGEGQKDEALVKVMREAFHHAGADKRQVGRFLEKLAPVFEERIKATAAAQKEMDDAFDALVQKAFGAENAKVLEQAKAMMAEHTPAELKPFLGKISNENLVILAGVLNAVHAKYGLEDKVKTGGEGGGTGGDVDALHAEMSALIAKPEYRDEFHSQHAATRAKVEELAKKIAAAKTK